MPPVFGEHCVRAHPCNGCNNTSEEVSLVDSSGEDTAAFVSCQDCFFVERADLIVDIPAGMVSKKEKAAAENTVSSRKTDAVSTAS